MILMLYFSHSLHSKTCKWWIKSTQLKIDNETFVNETEDEVENNKLKNEFHFLWHFWGWSHLMVFVVVHISFDYCFIAISSEQFLFAGIYLKIINDTSPCLLNSACRRVRASITICKMYGRTRAKALTHRWRGIMNETEKKSSEKRHIIFVCASIATFLVGRWEPGESFTVSINVENKIRKKKKHCNKRLNRQPLWLRRCRRHKFMRRLNNILWMHDLKVFNGNNETTTSINWIMNAIKVLLFLFRRMKISKKKKVHKIRNS